MNKTIIVLIGVLLCFAIVTAHELKDDSKSEHSTTTTTTTAATIDSCLKDHNNTKQGNGKDNSTKPHESDKPKTSDEPHAKNHTKVDNDDTHDKNHTKVDNDDKSKNHNNTKVDDNDQHNKNKTKGSDDDKKKGDDQNGKKPFDKCTDSDDKKKKDNGSEQPEYKLNFRVIGSWIDGSRGNRPYTQFDVDFINLSSKNIKNFIIGTDKSFAPRDGHDFWNVKMESGDLILPPYQNSVNAGASYTFGFINEGKPENQPKFIVKSICFE